MIRSTKHSFPKAADFELDKSVGISITIQKYTMTQFFQSSVSFSTYSFSHHGSKKLLVLKGNHYWRPIFRGGRV